MPTKTSYVFETSKLSAHRSPISHIRHRLCCPRIHDERCNSKVHPYGNSMPPSSRVTYPPVRLLSISASFNCQILPWKRPILHKSHIKSIYLHVPFILPKSASLMLPRATCQTASPKLFNGQMAAGKHLNKLAIIETFYRVHIHDAADKSRLRRRHDCKTVEKQK